MAGDFNQAQGSVWSILQAEILKFHFSSAGPVLLQGFLMHMLEQRGNNSAKVGRPQKPRHTLSLTCTYRVGLQPKHLFFRLNPAAETEKDAKDFRQTEAPGLHSAFMSCRNHSPVLQDALHRRHLIFNFCTLSHAPLEAINQLSNRQKRTAF